ncbi:DMT family transporter [Pigmentiphaga soli]|uniref:DMT family transporter n=1 Tax=Pigmentiphaga soli TaxID=1007095 RepID=A0ABP8H065_9BURK
MPFSVFAIVLFAAALHAGWNAAVKLGSDKTAASILVAASAAAIAAAVLPFLSLPQAPSWPFIAASALIHVAYFLLVGRAYHAGDMGQTYPLMRGTAPLVVAFVGTLFLGEPLTEGGAVGIFLICFGVLGMALGSRRGQARGIAYALVNALVIASYTLVDGLGVRNSGAPAAYTLWVFLLTGLPLGAYMAVRSRGAFKDQTVATLWRPLLGGAASLLSYSLVLWAMTQASIPLVAALRETAILFGAAISILVFKENARPIRMAAACMIAAGATAMRVK